MKSVWSDPPREQGTEPGKAGTIKFQAANYEVYEDKGTIDVTITRVGGSSGILAILWNTSSVKNGAACDCNNVVRVPNTLQWHYDDSTGKKHGPFTGPIKSIAQTLACEYEGCPLCDDVEPYVFRKSCTAKGCAPNDNSETCDYETVEDTVISFTDGEILKVLSVKLIDDYFCEKPNERFAINVKSTNSSDATVVTSHPATTEILIREDGDAGGIEFDFAHIEKRENLGQARLKLNRRRKCPDNNPNAKVCQLGESGYSSAIKILWYTQKGKASPGQSLDGTGDYRPHPFEASPTLGAFPKQEIEFTDGTYERFVDIVIVNDEVYDFHSDKNSEKDVEELTVHLQLLDENKDVNDVTKGFIPGLKICAPYLLPKIKATVKIKDDAGKEYQKYNLEFYGICKKCKS